MGKVVEAVSSLQEACGMLAKKYGDTADECGEAFYWCGKALLDLARMENSRKVKSQETLAMTHLASYRRILRSSKKFKIRKS